MSTFSAILGNVKPAGSAAPPLPAWVSGGTWFSLWNFNPVGYPGEVDAAYFADPDSGILFTVPTPYPVGWADVPSRLGTPPYLINTLFDQNSNTNNLTQSGAARPILQITTSVFVDGVEYTYRGLFNSNNGTPYYNKLGEPTSSQADLDNETPAYCVFNDFGFWSQTNGAGASIAGTVTQATFPWLDETWTGVTVTPGTQTGRIEFGTDGAGGATTTGLRSGDALFDGGSATGTIYLLFKAGSLAATEVLFETGPGTVGIGQSNEISISLVAGVLTATIYDNTAVTPLANTKIKTISDTNWHVLALTWDTSLAAASQTSLKIDDSATGVTSPISSTLDGQPVGSSQLNVGSRNNAASAPFTGSMSIVGVRPQADSAAQQTAMVDYINSLEH